MVDDLWRSLDYHTNTSFMVNVMRYN